MTPEFKASLNKYRKERHKSFKKLVGEIRVSFSSKPIRVRAYPEKNAVARRSQSIGRKSIRNENNAGTRRNNHPAHGLSLGRP